LQDLDPNALPQTRSGRKRALTAASAGPSRPAKRPRIDQNLPREQQDALRTARAAEIAAEREERARIRREAAARDAIDRPLGFISRFDPLQESHSLGELRHECEFCQAVHFIDEQVLPHKQFPACCVRGDGQLDALLPVPIELRTLLTEDSPRARAFRKDIRKYNSALAFTSISYNKDTRVSLRGGIQCFQIHGELFHL
jgi:hypothetical protein